MQRRQSARTPETQGSGAPATRGGPQGGVGNAGRQDRLRARMREVGAQEDPAEAQADRLADAVMGWAAGLAGLQGGDGAQAEGQAEGQPGGQGAAPGLVPARLAQGFQAVAGADVSRIPVHVGAADQDAEALGAEAHAVDGAVYVSSGAWAPQTEAGQRLLAHELAHVVLGHAAAGQPVRRHSTGSLLRRGDQGSEVSALQDQLVTLGYMTAAQKATGPGVFGPRTEQAVISFQAASGLSRDGIVGSQTRSALANALAARSGSSGGSSDGSSGSLLKRGASGDAVSALQDQLVSLGYMTSAQKASGPGIFGPITERAVLAFQADQRLTVDGIVGPKTQAALDAAVATRSSAGTEGTSSAARTDATLTGSPVLREGSEGALVKTLQRLLNQYGGGLSIDGEFGPATAAAVHAFQAANGLEADCIVGPATASKLNSGSAATFTVTSSDTCETTPTSSGGGSYDLDDADPKNILSQSELNPTVKSLAAKTVQTMQDQGYSPYIFEGYRSMERQNSLYAQGRTAPGGIVTYVQGGGSWHNYGMAVDIVFWDNSHSGPSWGAPSSDWQALGQAGKAAGFTRWMGDSGWDFPHFEHHPNWGNSCSNLLSTYNASGLSGVWSAVT